MGGIKKYTFRWLLVSIFIVLCNYGMSQNFSGGLMGGFTTSQVNGDENGGFHRIGPMGGIFAEYHKTKDSPFFHVFELRFAEKGGRRLPLPQGQRLRISPRRSEFAEGQADPLQRHK